VSDSTSSCRRQMCEQSGPHCSRRASACRAGGGACSQRSEDCVEASQQRCNRYATAGSQAVPVDSACKQNNFVCELWNHHSGVSETTPANDLAVHLVARDGKPSSPWRQQAEPDAPKLLSLLGYALAGRLSPAFPPAPGSSFGYAPAHNGTHPSRTHALCDWLTASKGCFGRGAFVAFAGRLHYNAA